MGNNYEREILESIMSADDAIARYSVEGAYTSFYCLMPYDKTSDRIDISGCMEDTLHRLVDDLEHHGASIQEVEYTVYQVMGARQRTEADGDEVHNIDLGYVLDGQVLSFEREPFSATRFEETLYERFKLLWMMDHGRTLGDFAAEFRDYIDPANGFDAGKSTEEALDEWEIESGFSGSLYPCFEEFLDAEYQMGDDRLFQTEEERNIWKLDQPKDEESFDVVLVQKPYGCEADSFRKYGY